MWHAHAIHIQYAMILHVTPMILHDTHKYVSIQIYFLALFEALLALSSAPSAFFASQSAALAPLVALGAS